MTDVKTEAGFLGYGAAMGAADNMYTIMASKAVEDNVAMTQPTKPSFFSK